MKILSLQQVREADRHTIENTPIPSIELMERASLAFVKAMLDKYDRIKHIVVVCGPGNNGGDGLAIARLLSLQNYSVQVFTVPSDRFSEDYLINLKRLPKTVTVSSIAKISYYNLKKNSIIIDALLGSGINKPVTGTFLEAIQWMNACGEKVVSVDIPSGMNGDMPFMGPCVNCEICITFQTPKLGFFTGDPDAIGKFIVVDIGLDTDFINKQNSIFQLTTSDFIEKIVPKRKRGSHKGSYGHLLIIGGSKGMMGAVVLCAKAALRTGAGKVTCLVPECGLEIVQNSVPEAMCHTGFGEDFLSSLPEELPYDCIAIGPGLGRNPETGVIVKSLINSYHNPLVLDADALYHISEDLTILQGNDKQRLITPHDGEWQKLFGKPENRHDQVLKSIELSQLYNLNMVLKGPYSAVISPKGECRFNPTGNQGMATAGSGDTLTGIISGLISQKLPLEDSSVLGTYIHGLSGDLAMKKRKGWNVIASDLVDGINNAIGEIKG